MQGIKEIIHLFIGRFGRGIYSVGSGLVVWDRVVQLWPQVAHSKCEKDRAGNFRTRKTLCT